MRNYHKVPKRLWNKMTPLGQKMFNYTYKYMRDNQHIFQHPKADKIPQEHWDTTAWNAACIAAGAAGDA